MKKEQQLIKELNSVQLSEEQKEKIIQQAKYGHEQKKINWGYRIVLPSFLVMAMFFFFLVQTAQTPDMTTAGQPITETTHEKWLNETIILLLVNAFLVMTAIVLSIRLLFVTECWQHIPRVIRAKQILRQYKRLWIVHVIAFILIILTFPLWVSVPFSIVESALSMNNPVVTTVIASFFSAVLVTAYFFILHIAVAKRIEGITWRDVVRWQVYVIASSYSILLLFTIPFHISDPSAWFMNVLCLLVGLNICLIFTFLLRNAKKPTCPHCQHTFTANQCRKKIYMSFRIKCDHCQKQIYLTKNARIMTGIFSWQTPILLMITVNIFNPSWITSIVLFLGFLLYFLFYYAPRIAEFEGEEEKEEIKPLW